MSPFTRLAASLVLALMMWIPALLSLLRDSMDILTAGLYLAAALILAFIGVGFLASIMNSYAEQQRIALEQARRVRREIEIMEAQKRAEEERKSAANNTPE